MQKLENDIDKKNINYSSETLPQPNETLKENNSIGFCYVGTDRGYRSCIEVNDQDQCMSGDIFPNNNVCINPNLRFQSNE